MTQELEVQDNSAKYYEEQRYVGTGLKYHKYIIDRMTQNGTLLKGKILDVGCGTGILPRLYPTKDIIGVDASREMLKYNPGLAVHGNAEALDFNPDMFDTVFCRSVLHHLPNPEQALIEFRRVLKSGGNLLLWETNKSWLATFIRKLTQHGGRFSEYHTAFSDLPKLVQKYFKIEKVKYQGFLSYPLFGFPDIIPIADYIPFGNTAFKICNRVDDILSLTPILRRMSWAIQVTAKKV